MREMSAENIVLQGKQIEKVYGQGGQKNRVLEEVDIEIYEGDFTMIMGASGAGKSTLLYCLSGMDAVSSGKVFYRGEDISRYKEKQMAALRAGEFGFVFQQTQLVSNLTLYENVAVAGYAAIAHGMGKKKDRRKIGQRAEELLARMHAENARDRLPSQVSGGEAQRAAIARAVINEPGVLFADEPTGALNRANSEEVLRLLTELNEEGQSIVMVTHDIRAAVRGTRILYMEDGKILDERRLSVYREEEARAREEELQRWLSALQW